MNAKIRQGLGLLVVAVLAFLIFLPMRQVDADAAMFLAFAASLVAIVCALVGLILLAVGLLRPQSD